MSVKTIKKLSDCTKGREIAAGGEGKIYEHPSDKSKVIKVYHKVRKPEFVKHLTKLSTLTSLGSFVAPQDIFVDDKSNVIGFEMDYVDFNNYWLFNNLFNKGFCTSNNIDKAFKVKVLLQLKAALESIHSNKIVIGDLNQYNLFVSKNGDILFVDVDSYQTIDNKHSGVLLDDIRDWTTTDINDKTDCWAYDILAFWATTYCHPYKWVVPGNKESLEMRVRSDKSILTKIPNVKIPPLYEAPTGKIYDQFLDIFHGRRFMVNLDVASSYQQAPTIVKHVTTSNQLIIRLLMDNVLDLNVCDNYIAVKRPAITDPYEWVWIETTIQKVTNELKSINCDELYPCNNKLFAFKKDNNLYGYDAYNVFGLPVKEFMKPIFYFNNGYLCVIEYDTDIQWNFNIHNQLSGIDSTNIPVFAKSIIKRDTLIQNFGNTKYANVPYLNKYQMKQLPHTVKNAYIVKDAMVVEYRNKSQTEFVIMYTKANGSVRDLDLDYFAYFTKTHLGTFLVPEDGFIEAYSDDLQSIAKFDCSMCTRNSKLFSTRSGILLFEDKTLYLLNTK